MDSGGIDIRMDPIQRMILKILMVKRIIWMVMAIWLQVGDKLNPIGIYSMVLV